MSRRRITNGLWGAGMVLFCSAGLGVGAAVHNARMVNVSRQDLCVTEGAIEEGPGDALLVNVPKMRAYVNKVAPQLLEARIVYLGATEKEAPLGSGEMRRQFGLKLRAGDACNLVYAMWRIEPESKLVVSVKSNPGQHTSAECGNRGYRNIKAARSRPVPVLRAGDSHVLRAEMDGADLNVFVDGAPVWEGSVGSEAGAMQGPVGLRSDNARLRIMLFAAEPTNPNAHAPACRSGAESPE